MTAAAINISPVKMIPFGPAGFGQFYTQGLVNPSGALPGPVSVINSSDNPPSKVTKDAVDIVTAAAANYDYNTDTLTVTVTSSDKGFGTDLPPKLSLDENKYPGHTAVSTNNANDPAEMILTATGSRHSAGYCYRSIVFQRQRDIPRNAQSGNRSQYTRAWRAAGLG